MTPMIEAPIGLSAEDEDLDRLVLRGLREGLSPAEASRLDALVAGDPVRMQRVTAMAQAWTLAGLAGPEAREFGARGSGARGSGANAMASRRGLMAAGVGGALAASAAGWWVVLGSSGRVYQAPETRPLRATLADGTEVVLSRGGRFEVHIDGARRSVRMISGEACWTVAKDRTRPFDVAVAGHRLVVLGTRFNVDPDPTGLRVDLLEGSLRVESGPGERTVVLRPGQRYWAGRRALVAAADVAASAAWTDGRLVFEDAALEEVAVKLRRHTGMQIGFADPEVAKLRFSGVLSLSDPQSWKLGLEAVLPVRVTATAGGFEVAPGAAPHA